MLHEGRHVVAVAPNGFGKTISTLCATIPVAYENGLKIVYCCRTHTQNSRVIAELNGKPLARERYGAAVLGAGDRLELIRPVAGG